MSESTSAIGASETPLKNRKKRSRNFSVDEENLIQCMVEQNSSILNEKHSSEVTNKKKSSKWLEITKAVNMKGVAMRTVEEVKEKWCNMTRKAKKTFTDYRLQQRKTGGGNPPSDPSQATTRIIEIMQDTASFSGVPGGLETQIVQDSTYAPEDQVSVSELEPAFPSTATVSSIITVQPEERVSAPAPKRIKASNTKVTPAEKVYDMQQKVLAGELEKQELEKRKLSLQIQLLEKLLVSEDNNTSSTAQLFLSLMS